MAPGPFSVRSASPSRRANWSRWSGLTGWARRHYWARALAGMLVPAFGYVRIDGMRRRESEDVELEIRRRVVYLPADPWLPGGRTGREWVLAVGRAWGVTDKRLFDHAERLLDLFELLEQADQSMSRYSTGQRKKIALCATLATDAPILLLDEPFSGGLD